MADLSAMLERGPVVCAEGYLFECERRGYLQAGAFVPEVVLDHPEVVEELHREFVHAGSDVVEAFTYYGHRQKLRVVGKEDILEPLNRQALSIAAGVARQTGTLLAGNVCNTNVYEPGSPAVPEVRAAFEEQVVWAAEAGADMIIAETFSWLGEALLALEVIRAARRMPAVRRSRPGPAWSASTASAGRAPCCRCSGGCATRCPARWQPYPCRTGPPKRSRRCSPCAIPPAAALRPSRPHSTPSPAPARNWVSSPPPRSRSACATWASAAARRRTTSAPWPRRPARSRRPRRIPPTCPGTRSSARFPASPPRTRTTPRNCSSEGLDLDGPRRLQRPLGRGRHRERGGCVSRRAGHGARVAVADRVQEAAHGPLERVSGRATGDRLAPVHAGEGEVRVEREPERRLRRDDVHAVGARLARPGPGDDHGRQGTGGEFEHDREGIVDVPGFPRAAGQPDP